MKQREPVHFVAGFFEAIAPYAQRMRRKTERSGILGMPHAAEVHRFDIHVPEKEEQSDRCPCAHCSDSAAASSAASIAPSCTAVPALSGANSADVPCVCADLQGSADGAPTASTLPSKDRVGGNRPPPPAHTDTRPQYARTGTGCWRLSRNGEAPSEILHMTEEPAMKLNCTTQS